jgi:hypothetical protein
MIVHGIKYCDECQLAICSGERSVSSKIPGSRPAEYTTHLTEKLPARAPQTFGTQRA